MTPIRILLFILVIAAPSLASAQVMNFEEAAGLLGGSCAKDIDDNCRGVNLDPVRLKECFVRNGDSISPKCQADYPRAFSAIQQRVSARTTLLKFCRFEMRKICSEVAGDTAKTVECLLASTKKLTGDCNKALTATGYR